MKTLSKLADGRILATNYLIELSLGEYLNMASEILQNNEYQRKRVKSSLTIYALLKKDFLEGCVIPPIVLALSKTESEAAPDGINLDLNFMISHSSDLVILDGLQRTLTLQDLVAEVRANDDERQTTLLLNRTLRLEVYVGINKLGVLYRMLTLNTGQTPMSLRQQIEMLYLDYAKTAINGVTLVREKDDETITALGEYSFKSMIEGFNSYIDRNELPIDRYDLLENIKSLEKLSEEDASADIFADFVSTYHAFVAKILQTTNHAEFSSEHLEIAGQPFGKDARRIFTKSQAITGFGAAVGKLRDFRAISGFTEVKDSIDNLVTQGNDGNGVEKLLQRLEQIRLSSKKIGNSQRLFFHYFFRELFNPQGDAYRSLAGAVDEAFRRYETQVM